MLPCQIVLEADGYQPYLISPEKGLRSLIKGVLELAKEPSRLCVDEVLVEISTCVDNRSLLRLHVQMTTSYFQFAMDSNFVCVC